MRIIVDSSVIIDTPRRRRGRPQLLRGLTEQGHELACCAIIVAEVYSGMRPHEAAATAQLLDSLEYVEISREAARHAGELRLAWQRKGKTLSLPDALIGAVALREEFALATDNLRHFSILPLKLIPLPET